MEKQNEKREVKLPEKKNKSPWILVGLLSCLVLVLILVILGYLFYRWAKRSVVEDLTNQTNVNLQAPTNESATLPAFVIYKNSRFGFSLSYPIDWWHDQSENGDGVMMSPEVKGSGEFNDSESIIGVTAYGWLNGNGQTLEEFLAENEAGNNQVLADYKINKQRNVLLGGLDAIRLDESFKTVNEIAMKRISIFHLDNNYGLGLIITCPESGWKKNSANLERIIDSYKLDKNIYNSETMGVGIEGESETDTNQIMRIAQDYVEANAVSGMEFALTLDRQTDEWARLTAVPTGEQKADEAIVLMKKENGVWVVKDFGTDLSQWYGETPGGFWNP